MNRRPLRQAAAVLAAMCVACSVGPSLDDYPGAYHPAGTRCMLRGAVPTGALGGELLALRPTTVVLVVNRREVWVVPYSLIDRSDCEQAGPIPFENGQLIPGMSDRLRLLARYPQGISDDLMARLVLAYGQSAPHVVGTADTVVRRP